MTILITGAGGFIGFHLSLKLLKKNQNVIGIDNLNNYYELILNERSNTVRLYNSNDMVLKGLSSFKKSLNL